jgi:hypothetical protein
MVCLSPPVAIHSLFRFPPSILVALVLTAVPRLLALCQGDFHLGDTVAKIDPQGNDGQSFGFRAARELVNLAPMKQQFAVSEWLMIPRSSRHVLGDMGVYQVRPARLEIHIRIPNVGFSFAQRFHFRAMQHQAGFQLLKNMVIIRSGAVLRDNLLAGSLGVLTLLRPFVWLGHNLSFYLMPRLITGKREKSLKSHPGPYPPQCRLVRKTWPGTLPAWLLNKGEGALAYGMFTE